MAKIFHLNKGNFIIVKACRLSVQKLLTHMSWLYRSAASLLAFHVELISPDVKQYTFIKIESMFYVSSSVYIVF